VRGAGERLYAPELHGRSIFIDSFRGSEVRPARGGGGRPVRYNGKALDFSMRRTAKENERQMASKTTNPFTFLQQVRTETAKVTWPTRRETLISTIMVMAFATLAAIFFFVADQIMAWGIELILGIAR
jgi:preprotein translocase subunit SecE